jgi:hypothetical protein
MNRQKLLLTKKEIKMNTIYVEALIKILDRIENNKLGSQYSAPDDIKKIIGTVLNDVEIEHHRDMDKLRKLKITFDI